jgi:hypothetical protein
MMQRTSIAAAVILLLACSLAGVAQDTGYWRASSNTAAKITGDIGINGSKLTLNFNVFPLAEVRTLKPDEVGSVFDVDVNAGYTGILYRVKVPAQRRFVHRNSLCGEEDTEWMATFAAGKTLQVAFFSGQAPPVFAMDAISNSQALCGTYTYVR